MDPVWKSKVLLGRFHAYLQAHNLSLADLGANSWDEVFPLPASKADTLPMRRRFYWTLRFFRR